MEYSITSIAFSRGLLMHTSESHQKKVLFAYCFIGTVNSDIQTALFFANYIVGKYATSDAATASAHLATRGQAPPRIALVHVVCFGFMAIQQALHSGRHGCVCVCVAVSSLTVLRKAFLSDITFIEYQEVKLI